MKAVCLLVLLAAVFASCDCGGGDDSSSSGDDDAVDDDASPDDDSAVDDDAVDDDTTPDDDSVDDDTTPDDDADDDTSPDDDNLAKDCWQPDLPPEEGYEWIVMTAAELIDSDGTSVHFVFDGEVPVVYWLEYPATDHRRMLRARWDESTGEWNTISFYGRDQTVSALEVDVAPDGRIWGALTACNQWSGAYLCVCDLSNDSIEDCHGTPWDDVRPTFVSLDHTPDGRPGILFWDFGLHPWYTEETTPGVWELGTIPGNSGYNTGDLTIGPDGVAHFTWPMVFLLHYFGGVNETWSADVLPFDTDIALGNIAISPDNELYLAASMWSGGDETMGVLHRQGWSQWDFLPAAEPWNDSGETNRVEFDPDDRLNEAYTFYVSNAHSVLCWARSEGDLWRKEKIDEEDLSGIAITWVYGMAISPQGVVGILYEWRDDDRNYLKVALRVPVGE